MSVAKTVYSQIKTLSPWALASWGAKELVALENGFQFKSSGVVKNKGIVQIRLNGSDLYDVTFGKVRKFKYKEMKKVTDVFVGDLVNVVGELIDTPLK